MFLLRSAVEIPNACISEITFMLIAMSKRGVTVALGLALFCSPVYAQQPKRQKQPQHSGESSTRPQRPPKPQKVPKQPPIQNPELTVERLRKLLKLNDDQVFRLRTMVNNRNLEIARAYQDGGTATSRRLTLESIRQRFQSEVRTLLMPAQIDRFERAVLEHPGAFRN
jgi:hypothetical protein